MRTPTLIGWLLAAAITVGVVQAAPVEGVVVSVSDDELVLDVGRARGLTPDTPLRLFRRLVVTHPITQETLQDRFPIGTLKATEVGDRLTIIRTWKGLSRPPAPGDFVVLGEAPEPPRAAKASGAEATVAAAPCPAPTPARAADSAALEAVMLRSLGLPPEDRVQMYQAFLANFSESAHAAAVQREIDALEAAARAIPVAPAEPTPPRALHIAATEIRSGRPFEIAVGFPRSAGALQAVRVVAFRHPEAPWRTFPMTRDGDLYYRVTLPAAFLEGPGHMGYTVEAVRDDVVHQVVAKDGHPIKVKVVAPPPAEAPPGASRVEAFARYVDFNSAGEATDAYFQFETAFSYVVGWGLLRSVRVGVGTIDGEGGETDAIDAGEPTRAFSVNYAFAETELALGDWVGLTGKLSAGSHHGTEDGTSSQMTGVEGRVRVGQADETRIVLGAAALDVLGAQGFIHLHIDEVPNVPIRTGVVVTNLPVDGDLGVQLEGQVGYRVADWITVNALVGWNARTINHYGFTGGGGLTLDW